MNLRNYEIDALCDFRHLHLLVNLGSIPDLRLSDEEVEHGSNSNRPPISLWLISIMKTILI